MYRLALVLALVVSSFVSCVPAQAQIGPAQYTNSNTAPSDGRAVIVTLVDHSTGLVAATGFATTSNAVTYARDLPYFQDRASAVAVYPAYPKICQPDIVTVLPAHPPQRPDPITVVTPGACAPDPRLTNYVIPLGQ